MLGIDKQVFIFVHLQNSANTRKYSVHPFVFYVTSPITIARTFRGKLKIYECNNFEGFLILTIGDLFDSTRVFVMCAGCVVAVSYLITSFAQSPSLLVFSYGTLYGKLMC